MAVDVVPRARYGEAFWRAHHEAWKRSGVNQREYCESQDLPLKAFGNWRAKFKTEPQLAARKLLYRRGGASHSLGHTPSHTLSHSLSHATYPSFVPSPGPIVLPTEPACACSRSGWNKASSSGRRLLSQGEPWHSPPCNYRPCSRGSIGAAPSVNGGPLWRDEAAAD